MSGGVGGVTGAIPSPRPDSASFWFGRNTPEISPNRIKMESIEKPHGIKPNAKLIHSISLKSTDLVGSTGSYQMLELETLLNRGSMALRYEPGQNVTVWPAASPRGCSKVYSTRVKVLPRLCSPRTVRDLVSVCIQSRASRYEINGRRNVCHAINGGNTTMKIVAMIFVVVFNFVQNVECAPTGAIERKMR